MGVVRVRVLGANGVGRGYVCVGEGMLLKVDLRAKSRTRKGSPGPFKSCDLTRQRCHQDCHAKTFGITIVDFKVWVTETQAYILRLGHSTMF